ncbi:hypothetical protein [Sorangium sp. So ce1099]|uniref:hypothetical protein n=1 Tax=Sorangium sp. So ce1099 TaxID=3133331 RepID=UPI003F6315D7
MSGAAPARSATAWVIMKKVTREEEADRFIELTGPGSWEVMHGILERQFAVLHNRAQVLIGLCGIVITTTGFSGRLIAGTSRAAQGLIIAGVAIVLLSATLIVWGVQHIRWLTQQPGGDIRGWLLVSLAYRDRKTTIYRVAIAFLLVGLSFYVIAIALMLLDPTAAPSSGGR